MLLEYVEINYYVKAVETSSPHFLLRLLKNRGEPKSWSLQRCDGKLNLSCSGCLLKTKTFHSKTDLPGAAVNLLQSAKVKRLDKFVQINNPFRLKQEYRREV